MMFSVKFTRIAILLLAPALPAAAHDLWLEKEGGGHVLQQGHRTAAHAGAERVPYAPDFVKQALCFDERGKSRPLAVAAAYPLKLTGDCAALFVAASSGYWTKTAWETKNAPKTGIPGAMKSWRSEDSVKRVNRWSAALAQPLTRGLEITLVDDPFRLGVDDKVSVRVTLDGKPRTGVPVAYDGATRGATGEDGTVVLKIRHGGLQMIAASVETPLDDDRRKSPWDGQADTLIRATTLNFELPGK
jgi:nickel transport protein